MPTAPEEMTLKVIAHIHTAFPTKFGIPRQSGLVDRLRGEIIFTPEYRNPDAVRGLEDFSHIWLVWQFSGAVRDSWSPTVRPPRLGGNTRMGVFATRSPFRPNPLGLSSVRLEGIEHRPDIGPVLIVRGADLMDGTPIYDIKPYLPYADCKPEASGGFAPQRGEALAVDFPADSYGDDRKTRHIETRPQISHYTVETSLDGKVWTLREDVARECSNGYYEYADGIRARYVRVTGGELPYGQTLRVSGLRVFGDVEGDRPAQADAKAVRVDALDGKISWQHIENAQGCNVRYGIAPDKLYQSWLVYDADEVTLSTLMAGQTYYVCVDSFNENGITTGKIIKMEG